MQIHETDIQLLIKILTSRLNSELKNRIQDLLGHSKERKYTWSTNFSGLKNEINSSFTHKLLEFLKLIAKFIVTINALIQQVFFIYIGFLTTLTRILTKDVIWEAVIIIIISKFMSPERSFISFMGLAIVISYNMLSMPTISLQHYILSSIWLSMVRIKLICNDNFSLLIS